MQSSKVAFYVLFQILIEGHEIEVVLSWKATFGFWNENSTQFSTQKKGFFTDR